TTFCEGGSVDLTSSAGASYLWSTGASTQSIHVTTSGSYTVRVTNANGCSSTSSATSVTVHPLPAATISEGGPTTFCEGGSVDLTSSAGASYLWSTGASTQSIHVTTSGSYTVRVTNANGCSSTSNATSVTVYSLSVAMSKTDASCIVSNNSATAVPSGGFLPYTYLWGPGGGNTQAISGLVVGTYTCNITDSKGCAISGTVAITSSSGGLTIKMSKTDSLCTYSIGSVTATPTSGVAPFRYAWSNGATTPIISNVPAGVYSCIVTDAKSCTGSGSVGVLKLGCGVTQLQSEYCGITLTTLNQTLQCVAVAGGWNYKYMIQDPSGGFTAYYDRGGAATDFAMSRVNGIQYGKTYSVSVSVAVGGTWSNYGPVCTVTTPSPSQLAPAYCGITLTMLNQTMQCVPVAGGWNYKYMIQDPSGGFTAYYDRGGAATDFAMSRVNGIQYGKTYSVSVSVAVGGTWSNYGPLCTVTTPSAPITTPSELSRFILSKSNESEYVVGIFPNPVSEDLVTVNIANMYEGQELLLEIYNLVGIKMYSQKMIYSSGNPVQINLNENYTNGIYFLSTTIDGKKTVQKFIVQK
ncbi:MAG TPA: T9SS type A sorting domain-containing protein, partial [Bacteroidia bacterium]